MVFMHLHTSFIRAAVSPKHAPRAAQWGIPNAFLLSLLLGLVVLGPALKAQELSGNVGTATVSSSSASPGSVSSTGQVPAISPAVEPPSVLPATSPTTPPKTGQAGTSDIKASSKQRPFLGMKRNAPSTLQKAPQKSGGKTRAPKSAVSQRTSVPLKAPPALEELQEGMSDLFEERQREQNFIDRGMRPRPAKPLRVILDPARVLGPLPRFDNHPFYSEWFQQQLDLHTDSRLSAGNQMRILADKYSWQAKMALMEDAKETLYVSTMLMICDEGGKEFTESMVAAAKRGVDVRFILDAIFSFYANPCLNQLRQGGVKVALSTRSIRLDKLDWESHEKHIIVDGEVAITGGNNVGSWYQYSDGFDENYRDTDLWLEGPIVLDIARRFVALWTDLRPTDRSLDGYLNEIEMGESRATAAGLLGRSNYQRWLAPGARRGLCRFVAQDPHLNTFHVWTALQDYVDNSKKRVILSAYALDPQGSPTQERLRQSLIRASYQKDALVDIITNGYGGLSNPVVPPLFRTPLSVATLRASWRGFGASPVRLFVYHYFIHAKQYYFDGVAVGIGSFNYDSSGNKCQESLVICMDPGLVSEAESLFARDIANSWRLTGDAIDALDAPKKGKK